MPGTELINVGRRARLKGWWVWALLALLLSYSFDLECLVEQHSCKTQVVHSEPGTDCTQPGLTPLSVALLPTTPGITVPAPLVLTPIKMEWSVPDLPRQSWRAVPLGLRAPPLA